MDKLWNGRFSKATSAKTEKFNASIGFDYKLYPYDILGSICHADMLASEGILSQAEFNSIKNGLLEIFKKIEAGEFEFKISQEDIHMNLEAQLTESIGEAGKKLHTGRSRNDQVALDMKLYTKDWVINLMDALTSLIGLMNTLALEHLDTIMPGFTHLQQAQPITLAHHLLAYSEMLKRDFDRLYCAYERMDESPLGAGALASTSYPINRVHTMKSLGFKRITLNSLDSVSDRDYLLDCLSASSILIMHLSRLCEEIILWNSQLYGFIELDDAYTTGSSIMPQKKNPDLHELIRGKTGRVYGNLMQLLTVMKGLPLAYNKDMQEDKELFMTTAEQILDSVDILGATLSTASFNREIMYEATLKGYTEATDLADYLVKNGLSFRDSHHVIGEIVSYAISHKLALKDISLDTYKAFSPLFSADLYEVIKLENIVASKAHVGGPAPVICKEHIHINENWLEQASEKVNSLISPKALLKALL